MQHYSCHPMFSRFDTIPECDRHTHKTHDDGIYHASIVSRGKNVRCNLGGAKFPTWCISGFVPHRDKIPKVIPMFSTVTMPNFTDDSLMPSSKWRPKTGINFHFGSYGCMWLKYLLDWSCMSSTQLSLTYLLRAQLLGKDYISIQQNDPIQSNPIQWVLMGAGSPLRP